MLTTTSGYDAGCLAQTAAITGPVQVVLESAEGSISAPIVNSFHPEYLRGVNAALARINECARNREDGPRDVLLAAADLVETLVTPAARPF